MKNTPLQSIIDDSLNRRFVVDKRGKVIFFPWGGNKQGYYLKSRSLVERINRFYRASFFICLVIFLIAASLLHNFWGIIGLMFVCFGGWYFVYYRYTSEIVKSLPAAQASYKDIVLEKLQPDDKEESSQSDTQFPAHWDRPIPQVKNDIFAGIRRVWYRLSPGQILMLCFFIAIFTGLIWSSYRPEQWINADYLVGFFVCLLLGYGGFVVTQNMESSQADWYGFIKWKLPMIVTMVAGWSFAAWFLYQFVVLMVVQR